MTQRSHVVPAVARRGVRAGGGSASQRGPGRRRPRQTGGLLLEFAGTIAQGAYRVTDEQVQSLRDVGWTDEQIAEGAYVAALFSLFVRLADTFDIEPPAVYEPNGIPAAAVRRD